MFAFYYKYMENKTLKLFLFIVLVTVINTGCSSSKLNVNSVNESGTRRVQTDSETFKIGGARYDFYIDLYKYRNGITEYNLGVSSIQDIEMNDVLLLKLGNNETVKLVCSFTNVGEISVPQYSPIYGGSTVSGVITSKNVDYYVGLFVIDPEELDKIEEFGIKKIRIEYKNSFFEQERSSNKLGNHITRSRKKADEYIRKPAKYRIIQSIEEGF